MPFEFDERSLLPPKPEAMLQRYILFWLVVSSGAALFWPEILQSASPLLPERWLNLDPFAAAGGNAIRVLIVCVMFGVGALLPISEVDEMLRRWKTVVAGTAVQYTAMPLLAWLAVLVWRPEPDIALGILVVGCVPGAMASNVLTLTAHGNVSYSVGLTTSATLLSPLVVPFALWLTIGHHSDFDSKQAMTELTDKTRSMLATQIVLPVLVGHLLSRFVTSFRRAASVVASPLANISILAIIAIAIALRRSEVHDAALPLLGVLTVINICGYVAGYAGGVTIRLAEPARRALTLEVGMQNAGAGTALAITLFGADSAAIMPCILYTFGCMLTGTLLATWWHWNPPQPDVPVAVEVPGT